MATLYRHYWGPQRTARFNLQWDIIHDNSVVLVTASEGSPSGDTSRPGRFMGAAQFRVSSIAPHEGGVGFYLEIGSLRRGLRSGNGFGYGGQGESVSVQVQVSTVEFVDWPDPLHLYTDITVF